MKRLSLISAALVMVVLAAPFVCQAEELRIWMDAFKPMNGTYDNSTAKFTFRPDSIYEAPLNDPPLVNYAGYALVRLNPGVILDGVNYIHHSIVGMPTTCKLYKVRFGQDPIVMAEATSSYTGRQETILIFKPLMPRVIQAGWRYYVEVQMQVNSGVSGVRVLYH